MWRYWKDRAGAQERSAQKPRYHRRGRYGDETARAPFKKKKLDRQQCRRYRRCKNSRHAARGACNQQSFSFGRGEMKKLCEDGANVPPVTIIGPSAPSLEPRHRRWHTRKRPATLLSLLRNFRQEIR